MAGRLIDNAFLHCDECVVHYLENRAGPNAVVGIDAPLYVPAMGVRPAELSLLRRGISLYVSRRDWISRAYGGLRGEAIATQLEAIGFSRADTVGPAIRTGRWLYEVYPYASLRLLDLQVDRLYKRGRRNQRLAALRQAFDAAGRLAGLSLDPKEITKIRWLPDIWQGEPERLTLRALDQYADLFDALICAYTAGSATGAFPASARLLGEPESGFILVAGRRHAAGTALPR